MNDQRFQSLISFGFSVLVWWLLTQSIPMAIGILLLIFIHEMGHYFAAKVRGIPVMLPTFTPLGAFVRLDTGFCKSAKDEAFIAYAGPLVGGIAALIVLALGPILGSNLLYQLGFWGVAINLLNLVPLAPLDGGRISLAIERRAYFLGIPLLFLMIMQFGFSIFNMIIVFLILQGAWAEIQFRNQHAAASPSYYDVGLPARIGWTVAYLGLAAALGWIVFQPQVFLGLLVSLGL